MTTHATGPLAGLSWLARGITLGYRNARVIFGAAALFMVLSMVPNLLQLAAHSLLRPDASGGAVISALATLLLVAILSPAIGGYLRLIDATEHGRPARATDIFQPFAHGGGASRLIGFGMLMTLALAVMAAVISQFGDGIVDWYQQMVSLSRQGGQIDPAQIPQPPEGTGRLLGVGSLVGLVLSGIGAIGFGQVALGQRSVGAAIRDGVVGTLKNLVPILVLAVASFLAALVASMALTLLIGAIAMIDETFTLVVVIPLYLALLLALHAVMFGVMYYFWRDVCADQPAPPRDGQVAM